MEDGFIKDVFVLTEDKRQIYSSSSAVGPPIYIKHNNLYIGTYSEDIILAKRYLEMFVESLENKMGKLSEEKFLSDFFNVYGLFEFNIPETKRPGTSLLAIKDEIYVDVVESLDVIMSGSRTLFCAVESTIYIHPRMRKDGKATVTLEKRKNVYNLKGDNIMMNGDIIRIVVSNKVGGCVLKYSRNDIDVPIKVYREIIHSRESCGIYTDEVRYNLERLGENLKDFTVDLPVESGTFGVSCSNERGEAFFNEERSVVEWKFKGMDFHQAEIVVKCESVSRGTDLKVIRLHFEVPFYFSTGVVVKGASGMGETGRTSLWAKYILKTRTYEIRCQ
jgi:hypothetical protein